MKPFLKGERSAKNRWEGKSETPLGGIRVAVMHMGAKRIAGRKKTKRKGKILGKKDHHWVVFDPRGDHLKGSRQKGKMVPTNLRTTLRERRDAYRKKASRPVSREVASALERRRWGFVSRREGNSEEYL